MPETSADELVRRATEEAPDGVLIVDGTGTIVYANRSMRALAGLDELVGTAVDDMVPPADRVRHSHQRRKFAGHPTARPMGTGLDLTLLRRDGERVPVEISLSPIEDGSGLVIAVVRDITERLQAQRRLESADQQLALVAERERIGRDLHDVVLQHIYGLGLTIAAIGGSVDGQAQVRLEGVVEELDRVMAEVRTIVFTLGSSANHGSLGQELGDVMAQASRVLGFTPALVLDGPVESVLTEELRSEMLTSMREALGNVARHAHATKVDVAMSVCGDRVVLSVADNGIGPPADPETVRSGHGLVNLQSRAANLGGTCALTAGTGGGAVLTWSAPF